MELETAIERVERIYRDELVFLPPQEEEDRAAFGLVLAAAKRPGLGEEERKELKFHLDLLVRQGWENKTVDALTAALSLAGPGFTKDDLEWLQAWGQGIINESSHPHPEERALLAKLDAYLETLEK